MKKFIANSNNQDLAQHSFLIAKVAEEMFKHYFSEEKYSQFLSLINEDDNKTLQFKQVILLLKQVAFFHDIGKLDKNFQDYISTKKNENFDVQIEKFNFETYPLHHELSFAMAAGLKETQSLKAFHKNAFLYGIYFHHATIIREKNFSNAFDILSNEKINMDQIFDDLESFTIQLNKLLRETNESEYLFSAICLDKYEKEEILERAKYSRLPEFQSSTFLTSKNESVDFFKNALFYLIRSLIVSSDRLVSKLSKKELNKIIQEKNYHFFKEDLDVDKIDIKDSISKMKLLFENSERSQAQSDIAEKLMANNEPNVLKGPAGVGKTKIILEYIGNVNNNKRNFIIVPRTSIANSLYNELSSFYLTENVSIEIVTGENRKTTCNKKEINSIELFQSDIVVTTIDQILKMMVSHKNIDLFLDVLTSNLFFDEFHEFLEQPAILMLFIQISYLKQLAKNGACLFVSATPNLFLIKEKMKIKNKNILTIKSFNDTNYKITLNEFKDDNSAKNIENEMFKVKEKGDICIFNTATKAQISAIKSLNNEENNTLVYHSKYFDNDKEMLSEKVIDNFGKNNPKKDVVLRSGPILQASLDISCNKMFTEISSIDNIYQRLGRVVRWNEEDFGEYHIYYPTNNGSIEKQFSRLNINNSTQAFVNYLIKHESKLLNIKLNEFYALYDNFFKDRDVLNKFELDFKNLKIVAAEIFSQGFEPVKIISEKSTNKKRKVVNGIRGSGDLFCLIGNLSINDKNEESMDFDVNLNNNLFNINQSLFFGFENASRYAEESRDQIVKYSKSNKILKEIEDNMKNYSYNARRKLKAVSSSLILSLAKNEDTPLVLSFEHKTKKIESSEQFFNVIFKNLNVGIMKKNHLE